MINIAIVGYGNIGKAALEAAQSCNDITVGGIVSRSLSASDFNVPVVREISELSDIDVAVLCTPSRLVPDFADSILAKGICTVDSYDIHSSIFDLRSRLDKTAKEHGSASIISAGWDPGSDSVLRALLEAMIPKGITYTNFGPGMSMGHTVAAKGIQGVKDALSITIPLGTGIHRRMVYVELEQGADFSQISDKIKADDYFAHDETHVIKTENITNLKDVGHGVNLVRKGVSGASHNQQAAFDMRINNPSLTGQILISCARAVKKQAPGCYTMIEIPPINFIEGEAESIIRRLV